jgi:hypothetical protein
LKTTADYENLVRFVFFFAFSLLTTLHRREMTLESFDGSGKSASSEPQVGRPPEDE